MRLPSWLLCAVVIAYVLPLALEYVASPVRVYDESQQLVAAELVADGRIPHRDFNSPYPPLDARLNALALSWLGRSAVSARALLCLAWVAIAAGLALQVRRVLGTGSRGAAVTLLGVGLVGNVFVYYWAIGYALGFLAILAYLAWKRRRSAGWMLVCGLLTGLLALSKLNFAAYVCAAIALDQAFEWRRTRPRAKPGPMLLFLGALALPLGAWLLPHGGDVPQVLDQVLVSPARDVGPLRVMTLPLAPYGMRVACAVAFPLLWVAIRCWTDARRWAELRLPLGLAALMLGALVLCNGRHDALTPAVAGIGLASLVWLRSRGAAIEDGEWVVLFTLAGFGHYALSRADETHLATLGPWVALLLPLAFGRMRGAPRWIAVSLVCALFLPAWPGPLSRRLPDWEAARHGVELLASDAFSARAGDAHALMEGPLPATGPLARLYPETDEIRALRFVHERTRPDEAIYVGLVRHARFFYASLRSYWIAGRLPAVRDYFLLPGVNTRRDVQERMVADLERDRTRFVVLWDKRGGDRDFRQRRFVGSSFLDDWLRTHYELLETFGAWEVHRRRGTTAPSAG